ncbi:MAG: signal transduction histidine kinase, LytS, partial [Gemmatimonadetes bacterium]|nr:signal transduction histidine kinase, LytS [Gemmatimonadota bacterium]
MRPEKESTGAESLLEHRWPFVLGLWAVPALLAALETYMYWTQSGKNYPFWRALLMEGPAWFSYALLTPAIFALSRRFPLQRRTMARDIGVHALASLLAGALYASSAAASALTFSPFPQRSSFTTMASRWFISALPLTTLTYFGILGAGMALLYFTEAQRRIADAARLSAQLAEARLGALRMQLHPHFLFN